jgi:hypothetical protein
MQITVSVRPGLPAGTYRVEWMTTAEDGDEDSGFLTIALSGAAMPSSSGTVLPQAAAAHTHEEDEHEADHEHGTAASAPSALPTGRVTFDVSLSGANVVPTPVSSAASAFARFTFDPATRRIEYTVWVHGVNAGLITGLHVHRGTARETGGHSFDILTAGPTDKLIFTGSTVLASEDVARLASGALYLNLHTTDYPPGAARGQLVLPSAEKHDDHDHEPEAARPSTGVRPPSTGDGGLAAESEVRGEAVSRSVAVMTGLALGLTMVFARKRA